MATTDTSAIELGDSLQGSLVGPQDRTYDAARAIYNGMIQKRPAWIARCANTDDVVRCITFARDNNVVAAVRGGGHSIAGNSTCDGGIVIDLSLMQDVQVDPRGRRARAGGGTLQKQLDAETQRVELATTGGTISRTGIAGLTLGGGLGWLMRKHGLACDNLLSVELVTSEGHIVTASASENTDLFWGLRGGGGNFGVATSFEYQLHPVGTVLGGVVMHPVTHAKEVLRFYREFAMTAPDELTPYVGFLTSPDGPAIAFIVCYSGDLAEGERVLKPLRSFGSPIADAIDAVSYAATQQTLFDPAYPDGVQNYWKSAFVDELSDGLIDRLTDYCRRVPSPMTAVAIERMGGAVGRVPMNATAFPHRGPAFDILITSLWQDPSATTANIEWTRNLYEAIGPFARGTYVNYLSERDGMQAAAVYGANYDRLMEVKRKYDPSNFFRLNQNLDPKADSNLRPSD